ncbi:S-methyl-5'-thioadenosine phosphorylase [Actinopolymorpha sp. B11F2]|uniref:S-methyl-5'-thioadenosine phosphorylase n=1 Tax=Actinopolymorpha sp. B11F2 TaxID=3160862 RepID=UPI0032E4CB2A
MTASPPSSPPTRAQIGVIGGSGFYAFLDDTTEVAVTTPYGEPSDPLVVGTVGGRAVAFLPRHGRDHRHPPHRINYRANLWALRSVGVRQVLGPCAVGSLRADLGPGSVVVPDQLVDRTSGRIQTYYDTGAVHVSFADPYCPDGRRVVLDVLDRTGWRATGGGTMVVIEGPRFSTRAESRSYAAEGWSLVNMTGHPEAVLARELGLCYTAIALVTDLDAGVTEGEGVSQAEVFALFATHLDRLRKVLYSVIPDLPSVRACPCATALDGLPIPLTLPE